MILCIHVFVLINLDDNQNLISMPNATNENTNGLSGNTTTGNNAPGNNASGKKSEKNTVVNTVVRNATVAKKPIVDMHRLRLKKSLVK